MNSEAKNTAAILKAVGTKAALFRNNQGRAKTEDGRFIAYGVGVGGGDWIGWQSVIITPEMVGTKVAIFVSIEVKSDIGKPSADQITWAKNVQSAGGKAGFARSPEDALAILADYPRAPASTTPAICHCPTPPPAS